MVSRPTCRHCSRNRANRPLGLCWSCYYRPGVRDRYPSTSKYARHGVGIGVNFHSPAPARPPEAVPGSPEKLAVLAERARNGEQLWHPDDATK